MNVCMQIFLSTLMMTTTETIEGGKTMTTKTEQQQPPPNNKTLRTSLSLAAASESKTNIDEITDILGFINEEVRNEKVSISHVYD